MNAYLPTDYLLLDRLEGRDINLPASATAVVAAAPLSRSITAGVPGGTKRRSPVKYDAFSVHLITDGPLLTLTANNEDMTHLSVLKHYVDCIVRADGRHAHYKACRLRKIPVAPSTVMVDIPLASRQGALLRCWTTRCACAESACSLAFKLCLYCSEDKVDEHHITRKLLVVEVGGVTCEASDVVAFAAPAATCASPPRATTVVLDASTFSGAVQLPVTRLTMGRGLAVPGTLHYYDGPRNNSRYEVGCGSEDEVGALFACLPSGPQELICTRTPVKVVPTASVSPDRIQHVRGRAHAHMHAHLPTPTTSIPHAPYPSLPAYALTHTRTDTQSYTHTHSVLTLL